MEQETKNMNKVWFITGASRGFGRVWTDAALKRGDKVVATARTLSSIADFKEKYGYNVLTLELDVTNGEQAKSAVDKGFEHFEKIDIVLNNAGFSLVSTIEDGKAEDIRALYETNVIGPLFVIKAALPHLRKQGYGHILGTSSNLGHVTMPIIGYYCSSKWAFEAIHESLAMEIAQFGIKVTIVEPGAYATEFGSEQMPKLFEGLDIYTNFKKGFMEQMQNHKRGNPDATPEALFKMVDSPNPPLRFFLGSNNLAWTKGEYEKRLKIWEEWQEVAVSAQGN